MTPPDQLYVITTEVMSLLYSTLSHYWAYPCTYTLFRADWTTEA